jgi:hypothetical protein
MLRTDSAQRSMRPSPLGSTRSGFRAGAGVDRRVAFSAKTRRPDRPVTPSGLRTSVKETGRSNPFFEAAGSCSWLCWLYRFEFRDSAISGDAFSSERPVCDINGGPAF